MLAHVAGVKSERLSGDEGLGVVLGAVEGVRGRDREPTVAPREFRGPMTEEERRKQMREVKKDARFLNAQVKQRPELKDKWVIVQSRKIVASEESEEAALKSLLQCCDLTAPYVLRHIGHENDVFEI